MIPAHLLNHFDRISAAPDAIQRLRRFIVNLAMRGKLVEQDPRDEPAFELIKRIRQEKVRLAKARKIKELRPLPAIDRAKASYEIPTGWEWVPLGETVISHLGGGTPSKNNSTYWDGDIFWASVKDVGKAKYIEQTIDRITKAGLTDSSSNLIPPGNLIIVMRMGLGKVSINRVPIAINQDLRALALSSLCSIDYHFIFFKTHGFEGTGLTVKGIKVQELLNIAFPLPPFAEQHRIVAKVDELMTLCDRLEAAQKERESRRDRLAAVSLNRLNDLVDDPSAFQNHVRFYFNHLPCLTTRPEHIKQLRQTILNLAVRGQLVYQDLNDEPAPELLKRIQAKKVWQLKSGELRNQQALPDIGQSEAPFEIPDSWRWVRMDDCFNVSGGIQKTPARTPKDNPYPYIGVRNVYRDRLDLSDVKQFELIEGELEKFRLIRGDILVVEGNGSANEIGRCAIWTGEIEECVHQNHIIRCRAFSDELTPYVSKFLNAPSGIEVMKTLAVTSSGLYSLSVGKIRTIEIPLPPLAEQHRIVAKVDELMVLCDRLEAQLTTTQTENRRLLDAIIHIGLSHLSTNDVFRAVHSSPKIVSAHKTAASMGRPNKYFARALLSAEIVHRLHAEPTFGRTKHQKILHLCEHIARIEEISGEYYRKAAGPLDNRMIYSVAAESKKQHWYEEYHRQHFGHGYRPLEKAGGHLKYLERYWSDKLPVIRRVIHIMRMWDTDRCEMFATAYAAWNDLLIWKREPSEEAIIEEVLERWHERKKRFSEERWRAMIAWIRRKGFIPVGFGKPTRQLNERLRGV